MVSPTRTDPRAWQADMVGDARSWYYPLPARCLEALDRSVQDYRREPQPIAALAPDERLRADSGASLEPVRHALEQGRGFVILDGIPTERYSGEELQVLYWLVGHLLGQPMEQNVQGTILYDVRDTGQDVRYGARFSVTNAESSFHTDNSFGEQILDYVGLLCLQTARTGGLSQIVSGHAVHRRLREEYPDVQEILCQPFHVDRRGGVRPGQAPTVLFPIIQRQEEELLFRYLRYWIEVGHEKAGQPLSPAQVRALDVLDSVLAEPELRAEFPLKPGDMFFINNRWILHNRTAFEDHEEPARRRHLVRLWLRKQEL